MDKVLFVCMECGSKIPKTSRKCGSYDIDLGVN